MVEAVFQKEPSFSAYVLKDFKEQRVMKKVPQYRLIMIIQTLKNKTQGVTSMNLVCSPWKFSFGKFLARKRGRILLKGILFVDPKIS